MILQHSENSSSGMFYFQQSGNTLAKLEYRKEAGRMVIEHTEVDELLRGQNVGLALVEGAVDFARTKKLAVVPLCTFAKKTIETHKELQDVL